VNVARRKEDLVVSTTAGEADGDLSDRVDLLSPRFIENPYPTYQRMRRSRVTRQVVKTLGAELHAWVVTGYDDARALLADSRLSKDALALPAVAKAHAVRAVHAEASAAQNPRNVLFSDPPEHTRLRRLLGKAFTMRRVEKLRPWIEHATDGLLDAVDGGAEFDFVEKVARALPILVIGQLLGVPEDRFDDFRRCNSTVVSVEATPEEKQRAMGSAFAYLAELIARKRAEPGDDLTSALVEATDNEATFDEAELGFTLLLLIGAGYETTSNMISNGFLALLTHPEQLDLLRADPGLVPAAVEEFLRYESPLHMSTIRFTTSPIRVGDVTIPENEVVFVALPAANRDPGRFDEPGRLDVGRPGANAHLAFGHGIHHCLGAPLARLEGEVVFEALLRRFGTWELAVPADELTWQHTVQLRSLTSLPVRLR
jgi:cytochrome P450